MPDVAPQRDATLAALERLLAWSEVARSPQLAKFLDYIVRRTLDGEGASIKAYSIAVDVLGRSTDFDPQSDPIVRVQARRLRSLLDEYYSGPGRDETTRISLPVGRYIPEFTTTTSPEDSVALPEPEPSTPLPRQMSARDVAAGGITLSWFVLAVVTLGLAVAAFAFSTWAPRPGTDGAVTGGLQRPSVTIVEFQNLAGASDSGPIVAGLAIELVTDLEQFGDIEVRYGGGGDGNIAIANLATSDYVLTGIVRSDASSVQYSAILTQSSTAKVVWSHTISVPVAASLSAGVLDEVSRKLSLVLGNPRGPLHVAARQMLAASDLPAGDANPYLCRVLFSIYREAPAAKAFERVRACIASLPEADRETAVVLAISGTLLAEYDGPETMDTPSQADRLREASAILERAIGLAPLDDFIWEQHARQREKVGGYAMARSDFMSAIQLNPANSDALAAYANLLAFAGNLGEAEPLGRTTVTDTPDPPAWYFGVPALVALRDGDYANAILWAERYAEADREMGLVLTVIAAQRSGDGAVVNRYLPEMLELPRFRKAGVMAELANHVHDAVLLERIQAALLEAGVPQDALNKSY